VVVVPPGVVVVVAPGSVVVVAPGVVVVVDTHGFGEHVPGPTFAPLIEEHSSGVASTQFGAVGPAGASFATEIGAPLVPTRAPLTDDTQHWICPVAIVVVVVPAIDVVVLPDVVVVVTLTGHGFGEQLPAPSFVPPAELQSPGERSSHMNAPPSEPNAPPGDVGTQHWIAPALHGVQQLVASLTVPCLHLAAESSMLHCPLLCSQTTLDGRPHVDFAAQRMIARRHAFGTPAVFNVFATHFTYSPCLVASSHAPHCASICAWTSHRCASHDGVVPAARRFFAATGPARHMNGKPTASAMTMNIPTNERVCLMRGPFRVGLLGADRTGGGVRLKSPGSGE
jgi:hypothetical protein